MASGSRFPRRFVDNCNDHDVIFGRGKGSYNNPGNKDLQNIIRQHFPQYDVADLQTKTILAHKVVDVMSTRKPPSRFLKPDKDANRWYEMTREEVVKKIKQDFANLKSAHKRKIEDDDEPIVQASIPARKRPAITSTGISNNNRPNTSATAARSLLEQLSTTINGSEPEIRSEVSAIMAVVNQVFVHNPSLDHQKQAGMILGDDAVKEAIISILEYKAELHANMLRGRTSISPHARKIPTHHSSSSSTPSSDSSRTPTVSGLLKTAPLVKTDAVQMESVCEKIHFEAKMDDINNITPKLRVKDDRTYSGSVMNSSPHGIGFMKFDDGRIYCGAWKKGKLHGNACVLYKNGDRYLGEFNKNKRIGEGVCYYSDGSIYQGRFENDKLNGKGAYRSRDGNVYEGEFVNGDFEGVGVHRRFDGTEQTGRFVNWELVSSDETPTATADEPTLQDGAIEDESKQAATEMDTEKEESQGSTSGEEDLESQDGSASPSQDGSSRRNDDDEDTSKQDGDGDSDGENKNMADVIAFSPD